MTSSIVSTDDIAHDVLGELEAGKLRQKSAPWIEATRAALEADRKAAIDKATSKALGSDYVTRTRTAMSSYLATARNLVSQEKDVGKDRLLSDQGKLAKITDYQNQRRAAAATFKAKATDEMNALRATAPLAGFASERPADLLPLVTMYWTRFPSIHPGSVIRDAIATLELARNPQANATAKFRANNLLIDYYLPAIERRATTPERWARVYQAVSSDVLDVMQEHVRIVTNAYDAEAIADAADKIAYEAGYIASLPPDGLDSFMVSMGAPTLANVS